MKQLFTTLLVALTAMFGIAPLHAQEAELEGKIITLGSNATTLEEGKWYVLRNFLTSSYVVETTGNNLVAQTANPNNTDATASAGYLMKLEKQADGRYLIKTALGNYVCRMGKNKNNGTSATAEEDAPFTIEPIEGSPGHYTLLSTLASGLKYYMQVDGGQLGGIATKGGANSTRDWVIREANLTATSELTGKDYVNYILSKDGLVRLTNRRSSNYNLADNGEKTLGQVIDKTSRQQVWILQKDGAGYTLRNGQTGRFLNDDDNYRSPSTSPTTVYIQFSPNNSGTSSWINICEENKFDGMKCLNENGNSPEDLYQWSVAGDAGSDWTISAVEEFTLDEIEAALKANSKYKEVEDGKIYHIYNMGYGTVMFENLNGNRVSCQAMDETKYAQYWRAEASGSKFFLKNLVTGRYLKKQNGALSSMYTTTETSSSSVNGFTLKKTEDPTENTYAIVDNGSVGLHCDASSNVVGWYTDNDNSIWGFSPVELTDEEIAAAQKNYMDYLELSNNLETYAAHVQALFTDAACTVLKDEVQALSDEELAANADYAALTPALQAMVLKVKNNTWQQFTNEKTGYTADYERFFRVADYKVYSHYQLMADVKYAGMSNWFGRLSNPTGITGYAGDIVYIFVDAEPSADCTLAVEAVTGTSSTGAQTPLHAGLNAILLGDQTNLYIFYQLNDPEKYLADYPDIKIHIEGGRLNGYWDATRGMTNADWKLLQQDLLKESPVLNLKNDHLVFCMNSEVVQQSEPNEMEGLMRVWNTILSNEERYMGLDELEGRYNNIWNCFSVTYNYMFATTYGTYYNENTLPTVMNYYSLTHQGEGNEGGAMWGPSHEIGHNHQNVINIIGTTEASNNMFSNINQHEQGVSTTRWRSPGVNFDHFNAGHDWYKRDIGITTRMFFQLYLYFHEMKNDTTFLPRLFKAMRKNPLDKHGDGWDNSLVTPEGETGGWKSYGRTDYLQLAKTICDVAQADLSEFFESYGMFVPVENCYVGDYANYFVTTTQADIDEAKAYMKKYPKKLGNIMFIDDHIATNQAATPDPRFEAVPAANGLKVNCGTYDGCKMGTAGEVGQYSDYKQTFENTDYYYTCSDYTRKISINKNAKGAVGFKVYDLDGNLVYLSNNKTFTLPKEIYNAGFIVKAAEGNGNDITVPRSKYKVQAEMYYSGQEESRTVYVDSTLQAVPANALLVVEPGQEIETPEQVKAVDNVVDENGQAACIRIDGNSAWQSPVDIQAASVVFTKDNEGMAALSLPFAVTSAEVPGLRTATYVDGVLSIEAADQVAAGQPVVVEGDTQITLAHATVVKSAYAEQEQVNVLSPDGQSVVMVEKASPFLYNMANATGIGQLQAEPTVKGGAVYDLQGRRVPVSAVRKGLYIMDGKKVMKH